MIRSFFYPLAVSIFLMSCKTGQPTASKQEKQLPPPVLSESLQEKKLNGADFYAKGNIPASWTLEMDFGNIIRFKSLDGTVANSSSVQPLELPEKKATSYTSKASNGEIIVMVYEEGCTDKMSGEKYNKKVVVSINNKQYEGCGQYLFDAALNGKWILEKINNRTMLAADYAKGLPVLLFDLSQNRITGNDGCNNITGAMEIRGSKIKFSVFASTKMACPGNKTENEFIHLLSNQSVDYYFKDGQLYFYLPDDSIIIFKKG